MTEKLVTFSVQPTTGGCVLISLPPATTVGNLKVVVAKRLKVPKDKIILLYRNKQLLEGTLEENNIVEGSKLTLLPNVETGIMTQNPEQCVMQALETLNDSQVENFLAGRSPLHLTMRFGDHMMFIRLQLSNIAKNPNNAASTMSTSLPTPPTTPTSPSPPMAHLQFPSPSIPQSLPSPPPSPKLPPSSNSIPQNSNPNKSKSDIFTEASRSLTKTLQQLSSSALTKKMNENCDGRCCITRRQGGAIIESMYHHGRGVFSGTFTGTLSPSLQDKDGKPRRNICTIIHILNDLLGASSHCNPAAQCFCLPGLNATLKAKMQNFKANQNVKVVDKTEQLKENKVLREKVQHIQTMLKEKRQSRSAKGNVRYIPYSSTNKAKTEKSASKIEKTSEVKANVLSSLNPEDCDEQKLMDYGSETAVA